VKIGQVPTSIVRSYLRIIKCLKLSTSIHLMPSCEVEHLVSEFQVKSGLES